MPPKSGPPAYNSLQVSRFFNGHSASLLKESRKPTGEEHDSGRAAYLLSAKPPHGWIACDCQQFPQFAGFILRIRGVDAAPSTNQCKLARVGWENLRRIVAKSGKETNGP